MLCIINVCNYFNHCSAVRCDDCSTSSIYCPDSQRSRSRGQGRCMGFNSQSELKVSNSLGQHAESRRSMCEVSKLNCMRVSAAAAPS